MDDNERVIQALHEFENMTDADKVLTQELEDLFVQIAQTGRTQIPWTYLKPIFMFKLDKVMRDFFESSPSRNSTSSEPTHTAEFDVMRQRLLDCIESFTSAPFTVQRLCELMIEPKRHYKSSDKFMRGVEKNVLVVSTMADMEGEELINNHETTTVPNGPITNGIITTGCTTEMTSVLENESNGAHSEHYHDTHFPTDQEIVQHINGNGIVEKDDENVDHRTDDSQLVDNNMSDGQTTNQDTSDTKCLENEDMLKDKSNDDDSTPLEEKPLEDLATDEVKEQQVDDNTEKDNKNTTDNSEKESNADDDTIKQDLTEQNDEEIENIDKSQQEEEPAVNDDEPMEE